MQPRLFVPGLVLLLALAGCRVHAGYAGGIGYSTSYGSSGVVYNQPGPPQQVQAAPMAAAPPGPLGAEVRGSDGSFGWRVPGDEAAFTRADGLVVRYGCRVDSAQPAETLAECAGVKVLLRRDPSHVYRLCVGGTDRAQCLTTWTQIGH